MKEITLIMAIAFMFYLSFKVGEWSIDHNFKRVELDCLNDKFTELDQFIVSLEADGRFDQNFKNAVFAQASSYYHELSSILAMYSSTELDRLIDLRRRLEAWLITKRIAKSNYFAAINKFRCGQISIENLSQILAVDINTAELLL